MSELLDRLARLAHEHKLVPFIGAGCSLGHVHVDWNGITREMSAQLGEVLPADASNPDVAEAFVREHGNERLQQLLAARLLINAFDDANGTTPLQVLALELRSLYTTNQDNVLEMAAAKHGRPLLALATLADLGEVKPGDRILYKFHGSLDHPNTLIFAQSQYAARMNDAEHFMNIRLRSDLLAKHFLFIGYSLRDVNIRALFREMAERFPRALPGSYLLAYEWSAELAQLCNEHGIMCINPAAHTNAPHGTLAEQLERFLALLCERSLALTTSSDLESLFSSKTPAPRRIAIRTQVQGLTQITESAPPEQAIAAFRGICDCVEIPSSLHTTVSDAFIAIVRNAPAALAGEIAGAMANLELPTEAMWGPAAACIALANRIPGGEDLMAHMYNPSARQWPEGLLPLAAARAVELLEMWGESLTDNFYARSSTWFDRHWTPIPEEWKEYIRPVIERAWSQRPTIYENPIVRAHRLRGYFRHKGPSYSDIYASITANWPRTFRTPPEK